MWHTSVVAMFYLAVSLLLILVALLPSGLVGHNFYTANVAALLTLNCKEISQANFFLYSKGTITLSFTFQKCKIALDKKSKINDALLESNLSYCAVGQG